MNYNIKINHHELDTLIQKIQLDIDNIEDLFNKNHDVISKLDDNWIGPDKVKCDEEYFPYLDNISNFFILNMNKCLNLLKNANLSYQETNTIIKENTNKLGE